MLSSLSIFFPAYNDARSIPKLVSKSMKIAAGVSKKYEVIVVNDGSTDDTGNVLKRLVKYYPQLRVVTHKTNKGYGGALVSGFNACRYSWIFYTDGDGQYNPEDMKLLIDKLTPQTDVVNGYKIHRFDNLIRKCIGALYNWMLHRLYDLPIRDIDCDFRLIRKKMLTNISFRSRSGGICLELILKLQQNGATFREVGVPHYQRTFGTSTFFNLRNIAETARENLTLCLPYNRFFKTKLARYFSIG